MMSACNGPPGVQTLSRMVAQAGEPEREVEGGKPKKVIILMLMLPCQMIFIWLVVWLTVPIYKRSLG